jgi:hypothetical protein
LTTEMRMARIPFHVVPPNHAWPSRWTCSFTRSVRES